MLETEKPEITTIKIKKDIIAVLPSLIIILLIVFRIVLPYTFLKYKPHKNEFDPKRHKIVSKAIVIQTYSNTFQDRDSEEEYEITEVWYSPSENVFYSIDDIWYSDYINRYNRKLLIINYLLGFIIVILLTMKYRLTKNNEYSLNKLPKQFLDIHTLRFGIIATIVMIAIVFLVNLNSISHSNKSKDNIIYDHELYEKYLNNYK